MRPLDFIITVLAVKRLTRLVTSDEITRGLRERVGRMHPKADYLVGCQRCVSVWASLAVLFMPGKLRLLLAASESAILIGTTAEALGEQG